MNWLLLVLSLPTDNTAGRMRSWRAIKASGAAVLRDGVYLLPEQDSCLTAFQAVLTDVQNGGGTAYLANITMLDVSVDLPSLFLRDAEYADLLHEIEAVRHNLSATENASESYKKINKLRKNFKQLTAIDFFSNASQQQVNAALLEVEQVVRRLLSPDEPQAVRGELKVLAISDYQNKIWATRRRPWVDRLASAWLIRQFIDPHARFVWLESPSTCPTDAIGFDFDGAAFSHVGDYVTFEVLLHRFQLDTTGLKRLAALVHYLDVGGVQPAEANGVEAVLKGLCATISDDNQLMVAATGVFAGLLATFTKAIEEGKP